MTAARRQGWGTAYAMLAPGLALLSIWFVYPIVQSVLLSFQQVNEFDFNNRTYTGLTNYHQLISDSAFTHAVVITLIFVVVVVPLQAVGVLSSIGGAAAQSWMSRATGADEQGTVQGALTGIGAIAEMVVPVAASAAFAWSLTCSLPGLVFLGAGAFTAASTVLLAATPAAGSLRAPASITRPGGGERE